MPEFPYQPDAEDPDRIFYLGRWWGRCAFVSTKSNARCKAIVREGYSFCAEHNKTGQTRTLPTNYQTRFKDRLGVVFGRAMEDPELLSLRSGVAVVETRILELIENLEADTSQEVWKDLQKWKGKMTAARQAGDGPSYARAVTKIEELIEQGAGTQQKWADLFGAIKLKKEVASAEWERLQDLRCLMTADRAFLLVTQITDAVLKYVPEDDRRAAITGEILKIVQRARVEPSGAIDRAREKDRAISREMAMRGGMGREAGQEPVILDAPPPAGNPTLP